MTNPDDNAPITDVPDKLPPETAQVRHRPQPRRLRKNVVVGLIAALTGVLMIALVLGITRNSISIATDQTTDVALASDSSMPSFVKSGPQSYADVPPTPELNQADANATNVVHLGPAMQGDLAAAGLPAPVASPFEEALTPTLGEDQQRLAAEYQAALDAPVELAVNIELTTQRADRADQPATEQPTNDQSLLGNLSTLGINNTGASTESTQAAYGHQSRKLAFLANSPNSSQTAPNVSLLNPPLSPYELKAGSVIPCTLITGINSDLPGSITCQVRQNVFDTRSGNHLLIPQGTKILGEYDSQIVFGQNRLLAVWQRLLLPNGQSLDLQGMTGVDLAGYAGYADTVDNHWGRLVGSVILSSLFAVAPSVAVGNTNNFNQSIESEVARQLGSNIQQAGDQIVQREMSVQPTIQLRPGLAINVFVQTDLILTPYFAPPSYEVNINQSTNRH